MKTTSLVQILMGAIKKVEEDEDLIYTLHVGDDDSVEILEELIEGMLFDFPEAKRIVVEKVTVH
tara:strand:- start:1804 stop:1995 length:192 start_codon:yes stop_codon:yes gene_type:complete